MSAPVDVLAPAYVQEVTVTLTNEQATSMSVALDHSLRTYREQMGDDYVENAQPNSCIDNTKRLLAELRKVALGHKNTTFASYRMVPNSAALARIGGAP